MLRLEARHRPATGRIGGTKSQSSCPIWPQGLCAMLAQRVYAILLLYLLGIGGAAAASLEVPEVRGLDKSLSGQLPPPSPVTPDKIPGLGIPAGTPSAIVDIVTAGRNLDPIDRQTLAAEFPELSSIINWNGNDPAPSKELANVASTERSAILDLADELLRDERLVSTALSLIGQAINDIPPTLVLTFENLRSFLIKKVNALARSGTKAAEAQYTFDPDSCELKLPASKKIQKQVGPIKLKLTKVHVCKIINWLVTPTGVVCITLIDCATKVKSYLSKRLHGYKKIDIVKVKEVTDPRVRRALYKSEVLSRESTGRYEDQADPVREIRTESASP